MAKGKKTIIKEIKRISSEIVSINGAEYVIIEDEKQTRKLLRALLEDYCNGVEVLAEAADVQEGVEIIKKYQPELVFLDIEMPRESGFSLFKYFDK